MKNNEHIWFGLTLLLKVRSNVPRPRKAKYVQGDKYGEKENCELGESQD